MQITVRYFAMLREHAGRDEEALPLSGPTTTGELYGRLAARHHFPLSTDELRVAVNDEFTTFDHVLRGRETVVFIPPVAGG